MGKRIPTKLDHLEFPTRKDALAYFKAILDRTKIDDVLVDDDFRDVMALLCNHPRASEKIGPGVESLFVGEALGDGKCFHVRRRDSTEDNFSYKKCINGDPSAFTMFSLACRRAVDTDLHERKLRYFNEHQNSQKKVRCSITKDLISFDEAHVDHRPPLTFSIIVHMFVKVRGIDLNSVGLRRDGLYGNELADDEMAEDFREWHKEHANLRIIKGSKNLSAAFMGRIKPAKTDISLK